MTKAATSKPEVDPQIWTIFIENLRRLRRVAGKAPTVWTMDEEDLVQELAVWILENPKHPLTSLTLMYRKLNQLKAKEWRRLLAVQRCQYPVYDDRELNTAASAATREIFDSHARIIDRLRSPNMRPGSYHAQRMKGAAFVERGCTTTRGASVEELVFHREILARLSDRDRRIVGLRMAGYSHQEIGRIVNLAACSVEGVFQRIRYPNAAQTQSDAANKEEFYEASLS
jgi:hypothetical protein